MPSKFDGLVIEGNGHFTLPVGTTAERENGTITVDAFTTVETTSWTAPANVTSVEVLVVGGGASAGRGTTLAGWDGGGGAGGVIYRKNYPVSPGQNYTVTVGAGGTVPGSAGVGNSGGSSTFDTLVASGGGGGGNYGTTGANGASGGGGGGDSYNLGGTGILGQGFPGGASIDLVPEAGGGGGGAGGPGGDAGSDGAGPGGPGLFFPQFKSYGDSGYFAGGGGGGIGRNDLGGNTSRAPGGAGGGGAGGASGYTGGASSIAGGDGLANTGGGGGAGNPAGAGGSGIVLVRYVLDSESEDTSGQFRYNSNAKNYELVNSKANKVIFDDNIVRDGLINYLDAKYYFTGGTLHDLTEAGNNGTFVNSPSHTADNEGIITFNGSTQYVKADTFPTMFDFTENDQETVSCWVKTTATGGTMIGMGVDDGANNQYHQIMLDGAGKARTRHWRNAQLINVDSFQTINDGEWHHICCVRKKTRTFMYVDGAYSNSSENNSFPSTSTQSPTNYTIGAHRYNSNSINGHFAGSIANAMFYQRALTQEEVLQNFNAQKNRFGLKQKIPKKNIENIITRDLNFYLDPKRSANLFEGGAQRLIIESANARRGQLLGNAATVSELGGGSIYLPNNTAYVEFDDLEDVDGTPRFTVDFWARFTTLGQNNTVIGKYNSNLNSPTRPGGMTFGLNSSNQVSVFLATTGDTRLTFNTNGDLSNTNQWYNVCVTFDGVNDQPDFEKIKIFVNGQRQPITIGTSNNLTEMPASAKKFRIGRTLDSAGNASGMSGYVGEVKVYSACLQEDEVYQNFLAGRYRYGIS